MGSNEPVPFRKRLGIQKPLRLQIEPDPPVASSPQEQSSQGARPSSQQRDAPLPSRPGSPPADRDRDKGIELSPEEIKERAEAVRSRPLTRINRAYLAAHATGTKRARQPAPPTKKRVAESSASESERSVQRPREGASPPSRHASLTIAPSANSAGAGTVLANASNVTNPSASSTVTLPSPSPSPSAAPLSQPAVSFAVLVAPPLLAVEPRAPISVQAPDVRAPTSPAQGGIAPSVPSGTLARQGAPTRRVSAPAHMVNAISRAASQAQSLLAPGDTRPATQVPTVGPQSSQQIPVARTPAVPSNIAPVLHRAPVLVPAPATVAIPPAVAAPTVPSAPASTMTYKCYGCDGRFPHGPNKLRNALRHIRTTHFQKLYDALTRQAKQELGLVPGQPQLLFKCNKCGMVFGPGQDSRNDGAEHVIQTHFKDMKKALDDAVVSFLRTTE
ncbi:hypothetical protein AURDEDRAFT_163422 [Auricularia subglabra TFB-10046 SS5]|nr:hypothetical protein AURDEDRAFT_163422 [Auricularia subglabra TFB-10046 SS5]